MACSSLSTRGSSASYASRKPWSSVTVVGSSYCQRGSRAGSPAPPPATGSLWHTPAHRLRDRLQRERVPRAESEETGGAVVARGRLRLLGQRVRRHAGAPPRLDLGRRDFAAEQRPKPDCETRHGPSDGLAAHV